MNDAPRIFEFEYYQRLYDIEEKHWWARGLRDIMLGLLKKTLPIDKPIDVLDVGCGTGQLLGYLTEHFTLGRAMGIDISEHALTFCKMREVNDVLISDASRLSFASESFDFVVCIDTLQHLYPAGSDQIALQEFARLLRPGGVAYIRTNSALLHAPISGYDPNRYRRYRRGEMKAMFDKAGLEPTFVSYANSLPAFYGMLKEYRQTDRDKIAETGPTLTIEPPKQDTLLTSALNSILRGEAFIAGKLGLPIPFGHSVIAMGHKH